MSFSRKTYGPEVADAIVSRINGEFGTNWGLKICQVGGLEWLFLPEDLDALLPMILVQVRDVRENGSGKMLSIPYLYDVLVRVVIPTEDAMNNPRLLLARLRDLHAEFIKEDYQLAVAVDDPDAWGFMDCMAKAYGPSQDGLEELGIIAGEVRIEVRASADPYTPD